MTLTKARIEKLRAIECERVRDINIIEMLEIIWAGCFYEVNGGWVCVCVWKWPFNYF